MLEQARKEALFCQHVLAKSGDSVLRATLGDSWSGGGSVSGDGDQEIVAWQHYPPKDVFDPETGAQWYYHCHPAEDVAAQDVAKGQAIEHGHFHCFVRPDGLDGPIHHLVAIGVDARGQLVRLFTVNHWVVGDDWLDALETISLLPRFDVQLDHPSYLVNRWLTAIVRLYSHEISDLIKTRDDVIAAHNPSSIRAARTDRTLDVTAMLSCTLS